MTARDLALATSVSTLLSRRWMGAVVDLLVVLGIALCVDTVLAPDATLWKIIVAGILGASYFVGMEMALGGTLGKLITGLRVVNSAGNRPGLEAALARTFLRLLEVNPILFGAIPAALCVGLTKTKQRLGDLAAGTFVLLKPDLAANGIGLPPTLPDVLAPGVPPL